LTAGIVALSDASKDDAVPSVRELTEAARELDSAMSDARAACDDTVTTTEASANVANNYIDRLDELNSLSKLSAEQQREYSRQLRRLFRAGEAGRSRKGDHSEAETAGKRPAKRQ